MDIRSPLVAASFIWMLVLIGCVEPYAPENIDEDVDFLVVDGFLNASEGTATVRLTRAVPLSGVGQQPVNDLSASVVIEDDQGGVFPLQRTSIGLFELENIPVDLNRTYRVHVTLPPNEEFASEFVEVKQTPPIEKVFFEVKNDNLRILANTTDASARTKYVRYTYSETFEYTSPFFSSYVMEGNKAVPRSPEDQIYRCYRTDPSTGIILASTSELTADAVRNFQVRSIPQGSPMLQHRYSINVRQTALTEAGYKFWQGLYKTTQNVGGLFDPMPGEVIGNFKNLRNDGKKAIGFFSAATVHEQRIFVTPDMLPDGFTSMRSPTCLADTLLLVELQPQSLLISSVSSPTGIDIIGYTTSLTSCIDCRTIYGGATEKPPFWP